MGQYSGLDFCKVGEPQTYLDMCKEDVQQSDAIVSDGDICRPLSEIATYLLETPLRLP